MPTVTDLEIPTPETVADALREYLVEFNTSTHLLANSSITKRPDAVSSDYLTAYSYGPLSLGDASGGPQARVWRAKAEEGTVFVSRANDANTGWDDYTSLFNYSGEVQEIDLAFEQAGRAVISLEINGNIWLYWYDPLLASFTLKDFGAGRNGRVILDNPPDTTDSDVLLFYVSDANNAVVYRQQRDRYDVVYITLYTNVTDKYLEEAFNAADNRVAVLISVHDAGTGQYSLDRLETTLYPFFAELEEIDVIAALESGELVSLIINHVLFDIEEMNVTASLESGVCAPVVIAHVLYDIEEMDITAPLESGTLPVIVIAHVLYDIESLDVTAPLESGTLVVVVFDHVLFDIDSLDVTASLESGTLAP